MSNLANTYSALGRHRDALVLFQETLEFRQRVLPKKHPQIGVIAHRVSHLQVMTC